MIYECICLSVGYVCSTISIFKPLSSNQLQRSLSACDLVLIGPDSVDKQSFSFYDTFASDSLQKAAL